MKTCPSTSSFEGGGIFFLLSRNSELNLKGSSLRDCVAGTKYFEESKMKMNDEEDKVEGRGGGIYLDGGGSSSEILCLQFLLVNMSFVTNDAWRGRDVYILCVDMSRQVNETQFQFDLREGKYNRTYAIWGNDSFGKERDLMELIVTHEDSTIYLSGEKKDVGKEKICGSKDVPCSSFVNGLSHLIVEEESRIFVDGWISIYLRVSLENVDVKGRNGIGSIKCEGGLVKKGERVLMMLNGNVDFEMINFRFVKYEGEKNGEIFMESEGKISLFNCSVGENETEYRDQLRMIFASILNGVMNIMNLTTSMLDCDNVMFL
jgi:hypothetical protein